MNSFEFNKIMMALLLTVLVVFGINGITDVIFEEKELTSQAFPIEVEVAEEHPAAVEEVIVDEGPSLADLLATASVEKGNKVFKKCKACHTTDNGGKNLVGPNLWNVVGRDKGSVEGYSYSSGMATIEGNWTYEDLDSFLKKPSDFIAKTKMSFAGLKKAGDRAALIVLLRSFSDAPVELPAVAAEVEAVVEDVVEVPAEMPAE